MARMVIRIADNIHTDPTRCDGATARRDLNALCTRIDNIVGLQ